MDRFQSMAVFVATVETGSMAAAARALELPAALIGKQIQQLEDQLGARLFERVGPWQRLTGAGLQYHQQCRSILEMLRGAETEAQVTGLQAAGQVRVHAPVFFGQRTLAPALADFLATYPEVQVELVLDDRAADPLDPAVDAVFHLGPAPSDDVHSLPLSEQALGLVAAPAYLARHGTPQRAEELVRHRCLGFIAPLPPEPVSEARGEEADARDGLDLALATEDEADLEAAAETDFEPDFEADADLAPEGDADPEAEAAAEAASDALADSQLAPAIRLQSNNALALHALALAGAGITVLPTALVADDLAAGRLVALLPEAPAVSEPLSLLLAAHRAETPALTVFVDWVLARFRGAEAASESASETASEPASALVPEPDRSFALDPQTEAEPDPAA
ncbi:LysR substrate-binding domain-containing protein [Curvibacter sp. HBC61]|uniref:LysR substrate-binding domain-containing protein n=2 Tax=Curvibacter cyanobacteriorum TaxID=3026422 RepID=A0ABT5MWN3_9BURK|nr:LysR substrate-binding domain-containing protein [Curvibacter sp. HBC61]